MKSRVCFLECDTLPHQEKIKFQKKSVKIPIPYRKAKKGILPQTENGHDQIFGPFETETKKTEKPERGKEL